MKLGAELLSKEAIEQRVAELAADISAYYQGEEILAIAVLRGAFVFTADLVRALSIPVVIDFMAVASYGESTESSGVVRILKDPDETVQGRRVLLVEDIVDTGLTLRYIVDYLKGKAPKSLDVCALLDKPERKLVHVPVRFLGFTIPNEFVVGYGLDVAGLYRNLSCVRMVEQP